MVALLGRFCPPDMDEALPIGVDGEEPSCLFEPQFQSVGRTGVTSIGVTTTQMYPLIFAK